MKSRLASVLMILGILVFVYGLIVWVVHVWNGAVPPGTIPYKLDREQQTFWSLLLNAAVVFTLPFAIGGSLFMIAEAIDEGSGLASAVLSSIGFAIVSLVFALPAWFIWLVLSSIGYLVVYLPLSFIVGGDWASLAFWALILLIALGALFGTDSGGKVVGVIFFWMDD